MPPDHYVLFRHRTIAKDWAIRQSDGNLYIRFGKTNKVNQHRVIPQSQVSRALSKDMSVRIRDKIRGGYREVGAATFKNGRMVLVDSETPRAGTLYWRVSIPLPPAAFWDFVRSIAPRLTGWRPSVLPRVIPGQGLRVSLTDGTWNLGIQEGGELDMDLRGGGEVPPTLGLVPVLILMALDRAFPGAVTFADARGYPLTPAVSVRDPLLGPEFTLASSLASRLGLGPDTLSVVASDSADSSPSYWFT